MTAAHIPADFPEAAAVATISGAQLKFSMAKDVDGRLKSTGNTSQGRAERYAFCLALVEWAIEKMNRRSYAEWPVERLLCKLTLNLEQDLFLSPAERDWVLHHVRARLTAAGRAV